MARVLHRFDNLEAFPVLHGESSTRSPVITLLEDGPPGRCLRVSWTRSTGDPADVTIAVGLPFRAVDGHPEQLLLEVCGSAGRSYICVEARDATGWGFAYSFGVVESSGWHTVAAPIHAPCEFWGAHTAQRWASMTPPLQLCRLRIGMDAQNAKLDLQFGALTVTGDARITHPGIA